MATMAAARAEPRTRLIPYACILFLGPAWFATAQESDIPSCDESRSTSLREEARRALQKRQYDQAAGQFRQAFEACPQQTAVLLELSDAQAHGRHFPEGIRAAQQFLCPERGPGHGAPTLADAYTMGPRFGE